LNNFAVVDYDDGSGGTVGPENTNTATYNVQQTALIDVTDDGSLLDEDGTINDTVSISTPVNQGSVVFLDNVVVNNGNGSDTIELNVISDTFPAGSIIEFYRNDGVTPLTDTTGDSNPDTGSLGAGLSFTYRLKVTLPASVFGNNSGNGFTAVVEGVSTFNNAVTDTLTNKLDSIVQSTVDLTANDVVGGPSVLGENQGPETSPVVTNSVVPNATTVFNLFANNTSNRNDQYVIEVSTDSTFATLGLPSGWSVNYEDGSGNTITGTGNMLAGANKVVDANVTVASNQAPGAVSVYFRIRSLATGASDMIHTEVNVSSVANLSISPNNNGQVFSGGTLSYVHTITNLGNVSPELTGDIVVTNSAANWNTVVYYDANNNSVIDAGESVVSSISDLGGLNPGQSKKIIVKIFAPAGANDGDSNTTTVSIQNVTGETVVSNNTVNDATVIISGDITLEKFQSIDATCDGAADNTLVKTGINAKPGECIVYEIKATNTGTSTVNALEINDSIPAYTTYFDCAGSCPATTSLGTITNVPANGDTGLITAEAATVNSLNVMILNFVVKIDE
jgi:uncharacterized repeat protein (TIGR01451 family)